MTVSKWSVPVIVLVFLLVAGLGGCGANTEPAPVPELPSPSASPPASSTASSASEATIVSIARGEVLVMKAGTTAWNKASPGMTLEEGDRIKTGADSDAVITFFEGSIVELEADTEVTVAELNIAEDTGSTTIKLWQQIGKTRSRVEKLVDPASRYEVETPAGAALVRGTWVDVRVDEVGDTTVYVPRGQAWAEAQGESVSVDAGYHVTIACGESPSAPVPGPPPEAPPVPPPPPPPPPPPGGGGGGSSVLWRTWVQTTVNDFAGTTDNVTVINVGGGDGTVVLAPDPFAVCFPDQDNRYHSANMTHNVWGTKYQAQTFRAGKTGNLDEVALRVEKTGAPRKLVIELRNCVVTASGTQPGNSVYASIVTDNISGAAEYPFSFQTPHTVVSGTDYSLVLYQEADGGSANSCYKWAEDADNHYPNGMVWLSDDGGITWKKGYYGRHDFYFATCVHGHYLSGTFESSIHDCGGGASFGAIVWQSAVPSGTEAKFQIATNNDNSTWNFVGPDGASNTYYTTGGTPIWSGHDDDRYIKYKAYLQTAIDPGQTPELKQVWITYR